MATNTLFQIPERVNDRQSHKDIVDKAKSKKKSSTTVKGGGGIVSKISAISIEVEKKLGQYKDKYQLIQSEELLHDYITECIGNGYISIDTETTGLDPILDSLAGICIYTRGQKGSYIPINHVGYLTNEKIKGQLSIDFVAEEFKRLLDKKPQIDMFNASFDIRVLRHNQVPNIYCTWDGYLGARLMNENEPVNKLKPLHRKYVLKGKSDAFTFDELFKGVKFTQVPLNIAYLYASNDPVITTELCDFQRPYLTYDPTCDMFDRNGMNGVAWVFHNIEMPCVEVICDMEDAGVCFDTEYNGNLSVKYNRLLQEKLDEFYDVLSEYQDDIDKYKATHLDSKLDDPINVSSPTQLAVLFYDILGYKSVNEKHKRGTGADILATWNTPLSKVLLEFRNLEKLISTYIDKLPDCINPNDKRIHCKFNQYGADTGRMSSNDPNLQNIPSKNHDIRQAFIASDGYALMSSDYSQQEPRSLAALCRKQGDSQMYETFMKGKDLYSEIASKAFNRKYEDCLEFYLDENGNKTDKTNKEGKMYRTQSKSILLGVLYGRGEASIGEQLGCSTEKAKEIKESVFKGFPAIKKFEDASLQMARELGYVTTVCGRKRRLPDLQLDEFEFRWEEGKVQNFDPLDFENEFDYTVPNDICDKWERKLKRCKISERFKVIQDARSQGILITDNSKKIASATRQCVNARIQGSAADLTKLAMIKLNNHQRLKELGFRLLIPVHDEVICECPIENVKECSKLLAETMSKAAEEILEMPIGCDVAVSKAWYGEEIEV